MMDELKAWGGLVAMLISIGGVVFGWFTSPAKKAVEALDAFKHGEAERWEKITKVIDAQDRRIQKLESEVNHLPNIQHVHELQLALKDIEKQLTSVAASAEQSARISARVETYLMERGK